MKKRSLGVMFGLILVTLGIYFLVWLGRTQSEMKKLGYKSLHIIWLVAPIAVAFVLGIIQGTIDRSSSSGGDQAINPIISVLLLVFSLLYIGVANWYFWDYGTAVNSVTNGKLSVIVTLILFLFAPFVAPFIIQNEFNKISQDTPAVNTGGENAQSANYPTKARINQQAASDQQQPPVNNPASHVEQPTPTDLPQSQPPVQH